MKKSRLFLLSLMCIFIMVYTRKVSYQGSNLHQDEAAKPSNAAGKGTSENNVAHEDKKHESAKHGVQHEGDETTDDRNHNGLPDNTELLPVQRNPIVTVMMENGGTIKIELYPDVAPNTVRNFIALVASGFYNGVLYHRVIPNFMIQGGDPHGSGHGGPGYTIKGEFTSNGFNNALKHERGVISMARTGDPNSAGSQFFIMVHQSPHLDGKYASFGRVTHGMEVADEIVQTKRDRSDKPLVPQRMATVTVETFGAKFDPPEKYHKP